ncbi:AAA family ATPase, partial [Streptomyces hydrogenans]|uniref:AAA family ATPase n=1 Tax=Streptomyces hydrogenans TaxID=1873719 RepID=UPI00363A2A87
MSPAGNMARVGDRNGLPPTDPWEEFAVELVEREAPLALLTALAAQARGGHGRAVLVSGPVAAGKSVLAHNFADRAPGL